MLGRGDNAYRERRGSGSRGVPIAHLEDY